MCEYRGKRAPLNTPLFAFGAEKSVAQSGRKHAALQPVLSVVGVVVQEDAADRARLVHEQRMADRQPAFDDRLLKVLFSPAFQRVAPQGGE